jgi:hypothetical protein
MFEKTGGKPIQYQGKTLVMLDNFPTEGASLLRLSFEACNGEWRQGVALHFEGKFKVNGQIVRRDIVLWHDTAPQSVELQVIGKSSTIEVKNVWDVGDGVIHSWHNGAAMTVEPLADGRRYRCNDGFADDDFDDIVFRLERVVS